LFEQDEAEAGSAGEQLARNTLQATSKLSLKAYGFFAVSLYFEPLMPNKTH
jgi:hypothetical protein